MTHDILEPPKVNAESAALSDSFVTRHPCPLPTSTRHPCPLPTSTGGMESRPFVIHIGKDTYNLSIVNDPQLPNHLQIDISLNLTMFNDCTRKPYEGMQ